MVESYDSVFLSVGFLCDCTGVLHLVYLGWWTPNDAEGLLGPREFKVVGTSRETSPVNGNEFLGCDLRKREVTSLCMPRAIRVMDLEGISFTCLGMRAG